MPTWLDGAGAGGGGLLIPGGPDGRGADLVLAPDDVTVSHLDATARLGWSEYKNPLPWKSATAWRIAEWGSGPLGVGIDGPPSLDPIRSSTATLLVRAGAWNPYSRYGTPYATVALWVTQHQPPWSVWQVATVDALCRLLRDRAPLRATLGQALRADELATDLRAAPRDNGPWRASYLPASGAVAGALHALGYAHQYGRPLPSDDIVSAESIADEVVTQLRTSRYRYVRISRRRVVKTVKRLYSDIEPWPFAALGVRAGSPGASARDDDGVESACIGLENDGVMLFDVRRSDGEIWWCSARLRVRGLEAEKTHVAGHYAITFNDLIDFLNGIAADWRGWHGERSYESLEGDLRLTATHDGRHVRMAVVLRQSAVSDGWSASAVLTLDPGEQMSAIASDVQALLSIA